MLHLDRASLSLARCETSDNTLNNVILHGQSPNHKTWLYTLNVWTSRLCSSMAAGDSIPVATVCRSLLSHPGRLEPLRLSRAANKSVLSVPSSEAGCGVTARSSSPPCPSRPPYLPQHEFLRLEALERMSLLITLSFSTMPIS